MAHVHDFQRIFFGKHVHGPYTFVSKEYSLGNMYMAHVHDKQIFILSLTCTWPMYMINKEYSLFNMYMAHVHDKQRIFFGKHVHGPCT